MRYSHLFAKTLKQPPKEADTINHKLLTQAGFVDQLMAGVYSYLPLGLRVLRKIEQIVREEMNQVDGQEVLMPILHPKDIWVKTGGWDKIDVLFKINSRTEKEYALAQSAEEVVTPLVLSRTYSYKDLPISAYQFQWKFRDELRAKSGIMRGREFFMKDMYSFHETQQDFLQYYEQVKQAYLRIYTRLGLVAKVTEASGGSFSDKISYEFMVLTDAGEDDILFCKSCDYCINTEIAKTKKGDNCPKCEGRLDQGKASEVGNVFDLGQKYGKDFDLSFTDRNDQKQYPFMGCYGIGISRAMGVIVEKFNDEKGIIWPKNVAPYMVHLVGIDLNDEIVKQKAEKLYNDLQNKQIEVLFDDREDVSIGEKLNDADLIGLPYRVIVSKRTEDKFEVKPRLEGDVQMLSFDQLVENIKDKD